MKKSKLQYAVPGLSLEETLFCGQTFSWQKTDDMRFLGVVESRAVYASIQNSQLEIENISAKAFTAEDDLFWQHYFALDIDYEKLKSSFIKYSPMDECIAFSPGIRVLRQPFFETLLSFIISQNNHIPRITGIVQRLREGFGTQLGANLYAFPDAQRLASCSVEDLSPLRAGFRSKYLIDAAQKVSCGLVCEKALSSLSFTDAREHLKQIYGVGDKVADCILLYSQGRFEIVPMDVWMKRAMEVYFPSGYPEEILPFAGIAQQFTFAWARKNLPKKIKEK